MYLQCLDYKDKYWTEYQGSDTVKRPVAIETSGNRDKWQSRQVARDKWQVASGKRQVASGKRQEARGKAWFHVVVTRKSNHLSQSTPYLQILHPQLHIKLSPF